MFKEVEMRTAQDILENMEEEINRLRAELNNSKNFHCPHYLTNDSGGVSCHRDFEKEIASLKDKLAIENAEKIAETHLRISAEKALE